MSVLVMGATGTVGREVYRALRDAGAEPIAASRDVAAAASLLGEGRIRAFDLQTGQGLHTVFSNVDAAFFMTPLIDDQVALSRRAIDAAIDAGVSQIVQLSSRAAGWDNVSALRQWHREIEMLVQQNGTKWTILRPCSFLQNFVTHHAYAIKKMSAIALPQGFGLIPYIDAADIGDAAAACLLRPDRHAGATYTLTGARAYGIKGVAAEIGRVTGKPITYIDIDPQQAADMMRRQGAAEWLIQASLRVFEHALDGGEAAVDPDLAQLLGRPPTSLSEFADRYREAWR